MCVMMNDVNRVRVVQVPSSVTDMLKIYDHVEIASWWQNVSSRSTSVHSDRYESGRRDAFRTKTEALNVHKLIRSLAITHIQTPVD